MMGFLSAISKGLDYLSAPLSKPKVFFTKGPTAGAKAVKASRFKISRGNKREAAKVIGTTLLSTGVAASAVVGSASAPVVGGIRAIATKKAAKAAAKAALGSPTVRKIGGIAAVGAIVAPRTFKKVITEPEIAKTVVAASVNPVLGVATAIEQGTNLVKASAEANQGGLKTAGTLAGGAVAAGLGLYGAKKIKDIVSPAGLIKDKVLGKSKPPEQINTTVPKTPATEEVTPTITPTNEKEVSKMPNMSQTVNVKVNNSQTKRIINGVSIRV